MIVVAADIRAAKGRNFLAWSAASAVFNVAILVAINAFQPGRAPGLTAKSWTIIAELSLVVALSAAVLGFSMRNIPFNARNLRNQFILIVTIIVVALLTIWGARALLGSVLLGTSATVALIVGLVLCVLAILGLVAVTAARLRIDIISAEQAEDLRERGRMTAYSFMSMISMGLALAVLALGGPGGLVPPAVALAVALALLAITTLIGVMVWPLMDELMRAMTRETGNLGFYLIAVLGGGWAMLAHLSFVAGPAPLDWLTMFTLLMYAASFIAVGRRGLLKG